MYNRTIPPWWLSPSKLIIFFIVPIYAISCLYSRQILSDLNIQYNAITDETWEIGLLSILAFAFGSYLAERGINVLRAASKPLYMPLPKIERSLFWLSSISIMSYAIFLFPIISNIDLLAEFLRGSSEIRFRYILLRVPGITSLMQLSVVYCSLYFYATFNGYKIREKYRIALLVLIILTFTRAILFSERLALLEIIVSFAVTYSSFRMRSGVVRGILPFIGIVVLFFLFSVFEYFRSWQYYKYYYDTFSGFITMRFFAYYVTSINNGAGILSNMAPLGFPYVSGSWFINFPIVQLLWPDFGRDDFLTVYLTRLGTPEFNNPGGIFVLLFEYGLPVGIFLMFLTGVITGAVFQNFRQQRTFSLLLYPIWFMGLLDIIRIYYWGETRFLPIFISCFAVATYMEGNNEDRSVRCSIQ